MAAAKGSVSHKKPASADNLVHFSLVQLITQKSLVVLQIPRGCKLTISCSRAHCHDKLDTCTYSDH